MNKHLKETLRMTLRSGAYALICVALAGCSNRRSDLAEVSGVVTLDDKALPRATVVFQPDSAGPASYGLTDEQGRYKMMYDTAISGAVVGNHTVKISTFQEKNNDVKPPLPAAPEVLPAQYNIRSELRAVVKPSTSNQIDFPLTSRPK
jgi:hypothetical protein